MLNFTIAPTSRIALRTSGRRTPGWRRKLAAAVCFFGLTTLTPACYSDSQTNDVADNTAAESASTESDSPITGDDKPDDTTAPTATEEAAATPATEDATTPDPAPDGRELTWTEDAGVETARLDVPYDYDDPDGPQFSLMLRRLNAKDPSQKVGVLLVNPGGPGASGQVLIDQATAVFSDDVRNRFDIIAFDPRGVGESTPTIECYDDADAEVFLFSAGNEALAAADTPEGEAFRQQQADELIAACETTSADIIDYVGTNNVARDIDSIRQALGEEKVNFLGYSYGGRLGATWLTLFPDTARAVVLDAPPSPTAGDELQSEFAGWIAFDQRLSDFFDWCDTTPEQCPLAEEGNSQAVTKAILEQLTDDPLVVDPDRTKVGVDVATTAMIAAMYDDSSWPILASGLADASAGNGAVLLGFADFYHARNDDGSYDNSSEALPVINCADSADRTPLSDAEADALEDQFATEAPTISDLSPYPSTWTAPCEGWKAASDPIVSPGPGGPATLVIGSTDDPATPIEGVRETADALGNATVIEVDGGDHTSYPANECVAELVDAYLIDLTVPSDDQTCGQTPDQTG